MKTLILVLSLIASPFSFAGADLPPLQTVRQVELNLYMGKWYEIASFPQRFQKGCTNSTAEYSLRSDGTVSVVNKCLVEGKLKVANGRAYAVDRTNAKLKVTFFWPFYGDYWVVDLGRNYEYAVVGAPDRDYLWILSRTPQMDSKVYQSILQRLHQQQFDLSRLKVTGQVN